MIGFWQASTEWFNPRSGGALTTGSISNVRGPGPVDLGNPPIDPTQDWVIRIRAQ